MTPATDDNRDANESTLEAVTTAITDEVSESPGTALQAVVTILQEAENVLEAIDVEELPEAIDGETISEAIDVGEIPDALRGDESADAVSLRKVIQAIDLGRTLAAMDVNQVWEAKQSIEGATDDLGGDLSDGDDDGLLGGMLDSADIDGELVDTDLVDAAAEELKDDVDIESGDLSAYQAVIQQQAIEGVDAFRDALLSTHGTFERIVETNRELMRKQDRQPNSRNPTAVSTLPTGRADVASVPNYATMPRTIRHSDGPTRSHIYGDRFRREREKREGRR
ncbi:hypothetical protein Halru_1916 [Halovivax ruber XH-70]|uniref:Uncharacterized protein n=1 Tax=Halovivax ruber (strain DSM 18193 / JCM 13892 / XH-70) TaxID=797302 RepID=L0ICM6_HALRX|nr:hypothetical protein [Halovivax ruber]AGB16514.1 hypothetical protein Halru_1916 [Halovivax ruber XH-70]